MKANVSNLTVNTVFTYEGLTYKVINRYPFIEAKCLTKPNEVNTLFCRHADEVVEVAEGTQILKQQTRLIW